MTDLHLFRIDADQIPDLDQYCDRSVFQTPEWLEFISTTQNAEPVSALVCAGSRIVGRYVGLIVKKFGCRILGSPFPGWTSAYMGFNLDPSICRGDALRALEDFAFGDLNCMHIEIMDRRLSPEDYERAGYSYTTFRGYEIDLTKSEEELLAAMDPACRWSLRKAAREGVTIEAADDLSFVDEYYAQLIDVFSKQQLVPTYSKERVALVVKYMQPTHRVLLLKANDNTGRCIATGIFLALNEMAYFWGGASWRSFQHLRPNEALQWYAMRCLKARNVSKYDLGGPGPFKRKYGGAEIAVPWGRKSRYQAIEWLRDWCWRGFRIKQQVSGLIRNEEKTDHPLCFPY